MISSPGAQPGLHHPDQSDVQGSHSFSARRVSELCIPNPRSEPWLFPHTIAQNSGPPRLEGQWSRDEPGTNEHPHIVQILRMQIRPLCGTHPHALAQAYLPSCLLAQTSLLHLRLYCAEVRVEMQLSYQIACRRRGQRNTRSF